MSKLHIYAQPYNHEDAWIVGNSESLTALRDAITRVLKGENTITGAKSFCEDGEGYATLVLRVEDDAVWKSLRPPYTEHDNVWCAGEDDGEGHKDCPKHPFNIIDDFEYEEYYKIIHRK
jgi:hypothetical protein